MNAQEFLRGITSETRSEQLARTLKFVGFPGRVDIPTTDILPDLPKPRKIVSSEDQNEDENEDASQKEASNPRVDFDEDYVNMLRDENNRLGILVGYLQDKVNESVPTLKTEMELSIVDYPSAYEATVFYSKNWFAESLFSDAVKVDLATFMLQLIKPYCSVNLDTLQMISDGNSDIMAYIAVPRADAD